MDLRMVVVETKMHVNYFKLRHGPKMCMFVCMIKHHQITLDFNIMSKECKTVVMVLVI